MSDVQFTILGPSGTGKTCFLLGMYSELSAGKDGFSLSTDDDNEVKFRNLYQKICNVELGEERFPSGTSGNSTTKFTLRYGCEPILRFFWFDYSGDALLTKTKGDFNDYNEIKSVINNSACLYVCIDGEMLCEDDQEIVMHNLRDRIVSVTNFFFSEYVEKNLLLPPIVFVVTKYDLCIDYSPEYKNCERLYAIIKKSFCSIFVREQQIITVIPVSVGINISKASDGGNFKPINMDVPVLLGTWFILEKKLKSCLNTFFEENEKALFLQNEQQKCENELTREKNRWWLFRSSKKIKELSDKKNSNLNSYRESERRKETLCKEIDEIKKNKDSIETRLNEDNDLKFFYLKKDGCLLKDIDCDLYRLYEKFENSKRIK